MRLIDADALRERMYHEAFETDTDMQKWDSGCWIRYKIFENALEDAPTVDTVKHGHWEVVDGTEPRRYGCSVCKRLSWTEDNYCSYCGAKMDEVQDEQ